MAKRKSSGSNALAGAISTAAPPRPSAKENKQHEAAERRYRAEDALRTLQRADECRQDKGLMRDVKSLAREQIATLSKIK